MQPHYTNVKVNNEIELCEISDLECKKSIERALLKSRISYYVRWPRNSIFSLGRNKDTCIICVNDNARGEAEAVVKAICGEKGFSVKFILKRSQNDYL